VAGRLGTDRKRRTSPDGIIEQIRQTLNNMKSILEAVNASPENVVRIGVFLRDVNDFAEMNKVYQTFLSQKLARENYDLGKLRRKILDRNRYHCNKT
jgi:2-iminobutanoate/2-iminopropanoate deaminase